MKSFYKDGAEKIARTEEQEQIFIAAGWKAEGEEPKQKRAYNKKAAE